MQRRAENLLISSFKYSIQEQASPPQSSDHTQTPSSGPQAPFSQAANALRAAHPPERSAQDYIESISNHWKTSNLVSEYLLLESGKCEIRNFARSIGGTLGQHLTNVRVGKEVC